MLLEMILEFETEKTEEEVDELFNSATNPEDLIEGLDFTDFNPIEWCVTDRKTDGDDSE